MWTLRRLPVLLAAATAVGVLAVPASAGYRVGVAPLDVIPGNPAHALADEPMDQAVYDPATRCLRTRRPGTDALVRWLAESQDGEFWGSYRCERWGKKRASLHAEGRAVDWHLDRSRPEDRDAADQLILLLLAPDTSGEPHALARRMGVQELIWDCAYWATGMDEFVDYRACLGTSGKRKRAVNVTVAHRDHIHIGLSKDGAMARTSFWSTRTDR